MPVHKSGPGCYQYGDTGKRYCGGAAKNKAAKQGRAIALSKARRAGRKVPKP